MQMLVRQEAAKQYMKEREYPFFSTEEEKKVDYETGDLSAYIGVYLPHGFFDNDEYVTALYCMDEDMSITTGVEGCRKTDLLRRKRLLMTYGKIPDKWAIISNISEDGEGGYDVTPSADLMQAFRNHFSSREIVGYTIQEDDKTYVVNYEGRKFEVPQTVMEDAIVAWSLRQCIEDYKSCLVFMSWR
jgi:hypothetical protein